MKYTLGIDYSSTSTGLVLLDGQGKISTSTCIKPEGSIFDDRILDLWDSINSWFEELVMFEKIKSVNELDFIGIESPAFHSKGKVVDLAAGYGFIKYSLLNYGYRVMSVTPSEVKKFATGKGNATKDDMIEATPDDDYEKLLSSNEYGFDGIEDLVDAYWVAKLVYTRAKNAGY